jgi:hypothetical protein
MIVLIAEFIAEKLVVNRGCFFLSWSGSIGSALLFVLKDAG